MRIRQIVSVTLASLALWLVAGCDRGDREPTSAEADEPYYRQGQQLVKQGRSQEALSAYLKVIARRGESAPESHLEAGLLYLQQIKDPLAAIYHFRKYLELQPNSRQAVYVKGLVDTAKREFARTLPAQPLESQAERLDLSEQLERVQRQNDELKAELAALRGGVTTPTVRVRRDINLDARTEETPPEPHTYAFKLPVNEPAAENSDSPVSLAPETSGPSPVRQAPATQPPAPFRTSPAQTVTQSQTAQPQPPTRPGTRALPTKPTATSAVSAGNRRHVVGKGDTLFSLAQKYYGNRSRWRDIYAANRDLLPSENSLRLGMEIRIP
jgi:tetratricopeptide (TPR) repeat protein